MAEARVILAVLACLFYVQQVAERLHLYSRWTFIPEFLLLVVAGGHAVQAAPQRGACD